MFVVKSVVSKTKVSLIELVLAKSAAIEMICQLSVNVVIISSRPFYDAVIQIPRCRSGRPFSFSKSTLILKILCDLHFRFFRDRCMLWGMMFYFFVIGFRIMLIKSMQCKF